MSGIVVTAIITPKDGQPVDKVRALPLAIIATC